MASEVEPCFIFLAIKFSSFVNCLLISVDIFNLFLKNWTVCLSLLCLHFQLTSKQVPKQIQIMAFLCSRLPISPPEMHSCHLAQWPWMASELNIKFSPLYSAPHSLPTSPSLLACKHLNSSPVHTAHCIPGSCRYHLLHLAGSHST